MKKLLSILLAVMLMLTFASLVACDGCDDPDPACGTYTCAGVTVNGEFEAYPEGYSVSLELKSDGSAVATNTMDGETETATGTWTRSDATVTITIDGVSQSLTFENNTLTNTLTNEHGGVTYTTTIVYTKQ